MLFIAGNSRGPPVRLKPTRAEAAVISLIVIVLLFLLVPGTETRRRQYLSCALCRLARCDYKSVFGNRWSEFEESECTRWFRKNIAPQHEHVWQRSSSMGGSNIFGTPIWVSDTGRPTGIHSLTAQEQIAVYQHIPNIEEAKRLFVAMRDDTESGDQSRYRRVHVRSGILQDWADSSFAKPWAEIKPELEAQ